MEVISSLYRLVLFASPRGTDELIEASILCSYCIASQFLTLNRLPAALVETIGRWSACLLLDAKNAEIGKIYHVFLPLFLIIKIALIFISIFALFFLCARQYYF